VTPTRPPARGPGFAASAVVAVLALAGCSKLRPAFDERVKESFPAPASGPVLEEADLAPLPPPVRRWIVRSGAVGRPRVTSFRLEFEAQMFRKPGDAPMPSASVQYNRLDVPVRLFFMHSRMFRLPVEVFHAYAGDRATMKVRVAGMVDVVDEAGDTLSRGETVTVLNDLCFYAPGTLVDRRFAWEPVDDRTTAVTFTNGRHRVAATLHFDEAGDLVDFTSDDRPALVDGKFLRYAWSTPVRDYREIEGRRVAGYGAATYRYPEGPFVYGTFKLRSAAWNVAAPRSP
jgi:hypothetical protein